MLARAPWVRKRVLTVEAGAGKLTGPPVSCGYSFIHPPTRLPIHPSFVLQGTLPNARESMYVACPPELTVLLTLVKSCLSQGHLLTLSSMASFFGFSLSLPSGQIGWVSDTWVWQTPTNLQTEQLPILTRRLSQTH